MRKREFSKAVPVALLNDVVKTLTVAVFFLLELFTGALSSFAEFFSVFLAGLPIFNFFLGGFPNMLDAVIDPLLGPVGSLVVRLFGETAYGALAMGVFSFLVLIFGLEVMGNAAESAIKGKASEYVHEAFRTRKRGVALGTCSACLLQSSSVATSLAVPFVASGKISLREVYPYLLGCNIGTTVDPGQIASYVKFGVVGLKVGLIHVLINVFAVVLWLWVPKLNKVPILITDKITSFIMGCRNSTFALIAFTTLMFYIIPLIIIYMV